jgi:hypothetical protein
MKTETVSGAAAMLYQNILASLAGNDGHPVHVKNPLVLELIAAGVLIETAPRDTWTDAGVSYMQCVVNVPAPILAPGARGKVWANQALRPARVVAVAGDRALIEYSMPAGRAFLWDVPTATTWAELRGDDTAWTPYRHVVNVSGNRPPARWRDAVASLRGDA